MASFRWVKEGLDQVDTVFSVNDLITSSPALAYLLIDSPLTFDWSWEAGDLTAATGTGFTPISLATGVTGPWHDSTKECVYRKKPDLTWTNGTAGPVVVTGVALAVDVDDGPLIGVLVFDDEEVLNVGDAIEVELFIGITGCDPDSIVTVMEA